jgi:hypothetical protein
LVASQSDNSTTYKPKVEFIDKSGVAVVFTTFSSSNPPSYDVGEKVMVRFTQNHQLMPK